MESTFSFKSSTGFDIFAKKWNNNYYKEHKGIKKLIKSNTQRNNTISSRHARAYW